LIVWHHRVETIWQMTPRQIHAWVALGLDRERMERASRLADAATAARSEGADIQRMLNELIEG
jgi:hypothetical protein